MRTVFLLENDPDILFVLEFWLQKEHCSVQAFSQPIDLLQSLPHFVPDMILLDYHTLLINQYKTFCRDIKLIHNYTHPILLLSSYPLSPTDPIQSFVDGVITKPFDLQEISNAVHAAFNLL